MAQVTDAHLYANKEDFKHALNNSPAHEHLAMSAKHGWNILDLTCSTPKCGYKIYDYVVDTRSKIEDDLNVKPCLKCGARGAWKHSKSVKPAPPIPVKKA